MFLPVAHDLALVFLGVGVRVQRCVVKFVAIGKANRGNNGQKDARAYKRERTNLTVTIKSFSVG